MRDKTATFIGHKDCYGVQEEVVRSYIIELIESGVTEFLCGGIRFMVVPPTADSTACPTVGGLCYCVWLSCHAFLIVLCIELGLLSVSVRASLFICCCISCSKVVCWFLAYLVGFARFSVDFVEGIKRGRPTCFLLQVGRPAFCYYVWRFRF